MTKLYIIGSLRNDSIPSFSEDLRAMGFDAFDSWYAAGPNADDHWRDYEKGRGHNLAEALNGHAARHVFEFDKQHLDTSDGAILVMPAGKSGHIELGYFCGLGKPGYILLEGDPDRYDVMYRFATGGVYFSRTALVEALVRDFHDR